MTTAADQFNGREEGRDAPLPGELFGSCRTANRDSHQRQLIGQQPCQADEELRAPTRTDDTKSDRLHQRLEYMVSRPVSKQIRALSSPVAAETHQIVAGNFAIDWTTTPQHFM